MAIADLGTRLRRARENARLTQEDVARALGVSRPVVNRFESGRRLPSSVEISKLARLYRIPVHSFFDDTMSKEDPVVVLWRDPAFAVEGAEEEVLRIIEICEEAARLKQLLGRSSGSGIPSYGDLPMPRRTADAVAQGEQAAKAERRRLDLGAQPIADMSDLLSGQGIWATGANLPVGYSGLFLSHASVGLVVLVRYKDARVRKRFSYAHEYAHALFDRQLQAMVSARDNRDDLREQRANAFAAAFLLPDEGIAGVLEKLDKGGPSRRVYSSYDLATENEISAESRSTPRAQAISFREVALIGRYYGVSYPAVCFRLRNLGYVNRQRLDSLLASQDDAAVFRKALGGSIDAHDSEHQDGSCDDDKELYAQVIPLALEAYDRELISRGKLASLLRLLELPTDQRQSLLTLIC